MPTPDCEAYPQGFPTDASGKPDAVGTTVTLPLTPTLEMHVDFFDKTPPPGHADGHIGGTGRTQDCYVRQAWRTFQRQISRSGPTITQRLPIIISSRCRGCAHMVTCTLDQRPPTP